MFCDCELMTDLTVRFVDSPEPPSRVEVVAQYEAAHPDRKVQRYHWTIAEEAGRFALAEVFRWESAAAPSPTEDESGLAEFIDVVERT